MKTKKILIVLILLLFSFVCIVFFVENHKKRNAISLAVSTLQKQLSSDKFEEYEFDDIVNRNGEWYIHFQNKKYEGVLGNDITVVIKDNNATVLNSE